MKNKLISALMLMTLFSSSTLAEVIVDHMWTGPAMHGSTGVTPTWTSYFGEQFTLNASYEFNTIDFNYIINCQKCTKVPFNEWALSDTESEKVVKSLKAFTVGFFKVSDTNIISNNPSYTKKLIPSENIYKVAGHSSYISPRNYPYFSGSAKFSEPVILPAGTYVVSVWSEGNTSSSSWVAMSILEGPRASEVEEITARRYSTNTGWYASILGQDNTTASYKLEGRRVEY